jgi:Nuclease-related domain
MSLLHNKSAGKPLRHRAQQLRSKALRKYIAATAWVLLPLLVCAVASFDTLFLFAALLISALIALSSIEEGKQLWKSSQNFDRGACGEEKTEQVLESLIQSGWIAEYNLRLPQVGDIDVWLRSPNGINFILNVKSHSTEVLLDGDVLKRRYYGKLQDFEKDFLAQIAKEVTAIKKAKKLTNVTPVVVFSDAKVSLSNKKKIRGAYVMELGNLVSGLQELDRT